jgi:hypothetical protein
MSGTVRSMPELGRLKAASERIGGARCKIDSFLDRFNGVGPETPPASGGTLTDSYRNDIDSIFGQLDRLEAAVSMLDHIG